MPVTTSLATTSGTEASDTVVELVDTPKRLADVLSSLLPLPTNPPSLYIDLEGINLSRIGTISILQIYAAPLDHVYLIDVHTLGSDAFTTNSCGPTGQTLKQILESQSIPKVFFDVRNDSDALFAHFNVGLQGVIDLQLMEIASRDRWRRKFLSGLAKCIELDAGLGFEELSLWIKNKGQGKALFAPELGGSYAVFNIRPLPDEIRDYCSQDVQFLPKLWASYESRLTTTWKDKVREAAVARVCESQSKYFNGKGRHMAIPPVGWDQVE
ncbi:uncharacterized protein PgNI_02816 [Pyricularia grisea]|uniref:3'-5' exonuclease domain-containing protein n=1 Tax=Pyricularia grisea TaxID=148305 RepID=A0A6P8BEI7_PYRGI|nr:uncharacterized protein PgNI_02816 [Pyricularia grisea]TLD14248.1 hypothetical protein PgNI_02816 [Pyricularia grisea]